MGRVLKFRDGTERINRDRLEEIAANDPGGWLETLLGTIDDLEQMLAVRPRNDNSTAKHALEDLRTELWNAVDSDNRTDS